MQDAQQLCDRCTTTVDALAGREGMVHLQKLENIEGARHA